MAVSYTICYNVFGGCHMVERNKTHTRFAGRSRNDKSIFSTQNIHYTAPYVLRRHDTYYNIRTLYTSLFTAVTTVGTTAHNITPRYAHRQSYYCIYFIRYERRSARNNARCRCVISARGGCRVCILTHFIL